MIIPNIEPVMTANRWYPLPKNSKYSYASYPTPQSLLRFACGEQNYKFVCETVTTDHIRAAIILPLGLSFSHLLNEPWAMSVRTSEWRMIMVSTLDPMRWITTARASGAIAWLKGNNMTVTYQWERPRLDDTGNKYRPPGSPPPDIPAEIEFDKPKKKYTKPKMDFDRKELENDLREGKLLQQEIMEKHGLSRLRVQGIAEEIGVAIGRIAKSLERA